jgi:group II intron reverse transcriptase/maturase
MLGIPAIYDRVCQQALLNRLEPIFEPLFDDASFGYRRGRSTKDAMRKVWKEIDGGREWIVDGDLKDFFGSVDHEKLLTLVAQRVADSRVLRLIKAMLQAGSYGQGKLFPSERGTPQGGVASPLLSNILLTPFDQEMRRKGYQLTRFADDWVITCKSAAEARAALAAATRILERLGVRLNPQKTRIVHIQQGFDFLGYRMVRTSGKSKIPRGMIQRWNPKGLIAYPTRKSIRRFRDRVRMLTRRSAQRKTAALIEELNPTLRGWAEYYKRAHVRTLFHKLDGWIVRHGRHVQFERRTEASALSAPPPTRQCRGFSRKPSLTVGAPIDITATPIRAATVRERLPGVTLSLLLVNQGFPFLPGNPVTSTLIFLLAWSNAAVR